MYKIYISGAIRNNPSYVKDFIKAKSYLQKIGFEVLSPLDTYAYQNCLPIKMCMFEAIDMLKKADLITFITEGIKSKGMQIERDLALYCNIPIINYQFFQTKNKEGIKEGIDTLIKVKEEIQIKEVK